MSAEIDYSQINFRKKNPPISKMSFKKLEQRLLVLEKEVEKLKKKKGSQGD